MRSILVNNRHQFRSLLFIISMLYFGESSLACSMYKLTAYGHTMVGCNEDAWRSSPHIWFVQAKKDQSYAACFTGSRRVGPNRYTPQSGMNAQGLVFSRLVAFHPKENTDLSNKKKVPAEAEYLTHILQSCATIDEVKNYIDAYDHSVFIDDVFMYVDCSGDYLIVEPYKLIEGNDASYVLSNFCPSITSNELARKQLRYKNGVDFIKKNKVQASLDFCRDLSDTMHVCRKRNGDGTLLTSIWDTENNLVNLYFYHDYDTNIQFNISEESAKGDHMLSIPDLFPINAEFEHFKQYKTPFNVNALRVGLVWIAGILCLCSLYLLISLFRQNRGFSFTWIKAVFAIINILLVAYLFVLATTIGVYYFDAPYRSMNSVWVSLSSYLPMLLLLLIVPIGIFGLRFLKSAHVTRGIIKVLQFNYAIYLLLLVAFGYWGLFGILN